MDSVGGTTIILISLAIIFIYILLLRAFNIPLISPHRRQSILALYLRFLFLLPPDPMEVVWLFSGYFLTRRGFDLIRHFTKLHSIFTAERGNWSSELCAYATNTGDMYAGLRGCYDFAGLGLVFAGLVWPCVEFGRVLTIKCGNLQSSTTTSTTKASETTTMSSTSSSPPVSIEMVPSSAGDNDPSTSSSSLASNKLTKRKKKVGVGRRQFFNAPSTAPVTASASSANVIKSTSIDSSLNSAAVQTPNSNSQCDTADCDHGHHNGDDDDDGSDSSSPDLFARTLAFSNMSVTCMFLTWCHGIVNLAYAHHFAVVHHTDVSTCPSTTVEHPYRWYQRDLSLLMNSCTFQWNYLQNISMVIYAAAGLLSGLFAVLPNPILPPTFRVQFFLTLGMSLWLDSVVPSCLLISGACLE